ncbi:MAG TPA: hypothetical protein VGO40_13415 [Longimicrobium sp.]|jgi:hypothetical protein|nr:hypothetical protein [Longimicrobium sp.]
MTDANDVSEKRPYEAPRLAVYGPLETLTLTNVTMNMTDLASGRRT